MSFEPFAQPEQPRPSSPQPQPATFQQPAATGPNQQFGGPNHGDAPFTPPADPSPEPSSASIGQALGAQWSSWVLILRGRTSEAFALACRVPHYWWINFLLGLVLYGVGLTFVMSRLAAQSRNALGVLAEPLLDALYELFGSSMSYSYNTIFLGLPIGLSMKLFLIILVVCAGAMFARVGVNWLTMRISGARASFGDVAATQGASYTGHLAILAAAWLVSILPMIGPPFAVFLLGFLGILFFGAEIAQYVGINRLAQGKRSMLIPFVGLQALWLVCGFIFLQVLTTALAVGAAGW